MNKTNNQKPYLLVASSSDKESLLKLINKFYYSEDNFEYVENEEVRNKTNGKIVGVVTFKRKKYQYNGYL